MSDQSTATPLAFENPVFISEEHMRAEDGGGGTTFLMGTVWRRWERGPEFELIWSETRAAFYVRNTQTGNCELLIGTHCESMDEVVLYFSELQNQKVQFQSTGTPTTLWDSLLYSSDGLDTIVDMVQRRFPA